MSNPSGGIWLNRNRYMVALVAIVMVSALLCGCISDDGDDGVKWDKPTQVRVEKVQIDDVSKNVNVTLKLYDAKDQVTEWDVQLRLICVDSKDFEMLNKTYDIKDDDFTSETVSNVVDTWYTTAIPFVDFAKSTDRILGIFTGKQMTIYAWIVYDDNTFKQDPTHLVTNTVEIPTDLLVPNVAPTAALTGPATGFVGEKLEFNASASTDDMGFDGLSFKWDWGDGHTEIFLVDEVEDHTYDAAGTYTVIVNVTDSEGAWDNATVSVTITEPLTVTVDSMGLMTDPGEHFNDTYVTFTIVNAATFAVDITGLDPTLVNATADEVDHNGTADTVPDEIDAEGTLTVTVYFVVPEDFEPTEIMLLGESYALP